MEHIARLLGWHVYHCLGCHQYFYDQSLRRKRLIAASREFLERGKADLEAARERLDRALLQLSLLLRTWRKRSNK